MSRAEQSRAERSGALGAGLRIAAVVVMTPVIWGAQCNPEPPGQCAMPPMCEGDDFIECIDVCSRRAQRGEACDVDPCAGQPVCDFGLACIGGTCQPVQNFEVFFCRTDGAPCATGLYCRAYNDVDFPRHPRAPAAYDGQCVAPAPEGSRCSGNWVTADPVGVGRVCVPGASCRLDPRGAAGERACFRGCNSTTGDGDCPCPSADRDVLADCVLNRPDLPPTDGICATCIQNRETCEAGGWGCCDTDAVCTFGECCHPTGFNCTPGSDECCRGSECGGDGLCHACPEPGAMPDGVVGCCDLELRGGVCAVPCDPDPPPTCTPTDCPAGMGRPVCTVTGTECEAVRGPEVCDGFDNDCNNLTDDIAPMTCMGPVPRSEDGFFQGCPSASLPGTSVCRRIDGEVTEVCNVTEGFCAWDLLGNAIDGSTPGVNECFRGAGDCAVNGCLAGEWCCSVGDGVTHPVCTRIGTINYQPPGTEDVNPWPLDCWEPNEQWVGSCPAPSGCVDNDDCENCATAPGCGWCVSAGQCLPGDFEGADAADCGEPGVGWLTDGAFCAEDCGSYFSCDSCARNSRCGYCTDTGSGRGACLPGGALGPSAGSCSGDWVRHPGMCI